MYPPIEAYGNLSLLQGIQKVSSQGSNPNHSFPYLMHQLSQPAIAFLGDVLKGTAAVLIGRYIGGSYGEILAGIFVVVGHNWPIVLGGKGGKGIATTIGLVLTIKPIMVLLIVITGVIVILTTRYVSLASITGVLIFPIAMIVTQEPIEYIIFSLILSAMAIYRHKSNILRLFNGTESKFGSKKIPE